MFFFFSYTQLSIFTSQSEACLQIGKDLVRIFYDARKIPEIGELWEKFCAEHPQLLAKVIATRTPKEFLISRVTEDMALQLKFVMKEVPIYV